MFFLFPKSAFTPSASSGVTCSFCLYPSPVSFVVTLLYKRISKGNILSGVTLYCTLDTSELRIHSVLWSFSSAVHRHITAEITVSYEPISLAMTQLGCRFVAVFTGQFRRFLENGLMQHYCFVPRGNERSWLTHCTGLLHHEYEFLSPGVAAQARKCRS